MPSISAQQLLDALTAEQRAAVIHPGTPVAIAAGAGTGKTRTVTYRIAYRAATGGIDPKRALAITHSRKAASEVRERINHLGVNGITIRTFHATALHQLATTRGRDRINIIDERHRWRTIADAVRNVIGTDDNAVIRDVAAEISWAQTQRLQPADLHEQGRDNDQFTNGQAADIYAQYRHMKHVEGLYDFDDLLDEAAADIISGAHQSPWKHVTVDEYQDVDPLQQHLLDTWNTTNDITVVGDTRQSVFLFKGAESRFLDTFVDRYPNAAQFDLVVNHRSTTNILAAANRVAHDRPPLQSADGRTGTDMVIRHAADHEHETRTVIDSLQTWHNNGIAWDDMAVLYRFNSTGARFETALAQARIPVQLAGGDDSFWDRPDVRAVLVPFGGHARVNGDTNGLELLKRCARGVGFDLDNPPDSVGAVRERWELHNALINLAAGHGNLNACDLLTQLQQGHRDTHIPRRGGVSVGTVHKAKGLEFEAVCVVDAVDGSFPAFHANTHQELNEERNIVYVAVTRAKTHLTITVPARNARKHPNSISPLFTKASGNRTSVTTTRRGSHQHGRPQPAPEATIARLVSGSICDVCDNKLRGMPERNLGTHLECVQAAHLLERRRQLETLAAAHDDIKISEQGMTRLLASDHTTVSKVNAMSGVSGTAHLTTIVDIVNTTQP